MTISILAYDEKTGDFGGAAATGSLCVGGWVLRGSVESGLSASQGSLPSTMWGDEALHRMGKGATAQDAVAATVARDGGRHQRQLSALDRRGGTAAFTGQDSIPACGSREGPAVVVAGNLLESEAVIDACMSAFVRHDGPLALRLLAALDAAEAEGGDSRGLMSAALLVLNRQRAPLNLRVDRSATPLGDLRSLHGATTSGMYAQWAELVPTLADPERAEPYLEKADQPV